MGNNILQTGELDDTCPYGYPSCTITNVNNVI